MQHLFNDHLTIKLLNRIAKSLLQPKASLLLIPANPALKGLMVVELAIGNIAGVEVMKMVVMQPDLLPKRFGKDEHVRKGKVVAVVKQNSFEPVCRVESVYV